MSAGSRDTLDEIQSDLHGFIRSVRQAKTTFWQISESLKTYSSFANRTSVAAMQKAIRIFVVDADCFA